MSRRFRVATLAALALAATAATLVIPSPAAAHTSLRASDPAANSTVPGMPEVVRLTFTDSLPITPTVTVRDPDGTIVNSGPISPQGSTVLQPVKQTRSGRYTVLWQLTAPDGHKSTGSFEFTVTGDAAPPSSPAAAISPTVPVEAAGSPPDAGALPRGGADGIGWWQWPAGAALVLGAATAAMFARRRRRAG